jgi:homoserine dehydrogenase
MKKVRLGLIGFGNVGQGFAHILCDYGPGLAQKYGVDFVISGIVDARLGAVYRSEGIQLPGLLDHVQHNGTLRGLPGEQSGWDALTLARQAGIDAVVELSFTNLQTGEPAYTHISAALTSGKNVVTSNKGPVALHYVQLAELARQNGVQLGVEGTVMSGTPALRLGRELLSAAEIIGIEGILNGTTNFILTRMEAGATYPEALAEAQGLGYAEADPTGDVEGIDAAGKVVILARLLLGAEIGMADVDRQGITQLTPADIAAARAAGERWKLIGSLEIGQAGISARVRPTRLQLSNPLAGISGATNAILFHTKLLGNVTLIGPGAGRLETGYAVLEDLLAIYK